MNKLLINNDYIVITNYDIHTNNKLTFIINQLDNTLNDSSINENNIDNIINNSMKYSYSKLFNCEY